MDGALPEVKQARHQPGPVGARPPGVFGMPAHPGSSGVAASSRMSSARRRDTVPEVALRRALHAAGMRFRVVHPVPGNRRRTIDIAFTRRRLAVFVDGCFWHGCAEHGTAPRANADWWGEKIATNQSRDRDTDRLLIEAGWSVLRVWEHVEVSRAVEVVQAELLLSASTSRRMFQA